jgi:endonuclease/exonuclease/phosphatase family metal-dependent hydrolase
MPSTVKPDPPKPAWEELALASQLDSTQLDNIKAQLDLVLLALEALANVGSDAILQAAATLDLTNVVADRVSLWRLRQSSPLRRGQGRKRLDVEEARALVLIICHLAKQHQELIRRAVALLEQLTEQNREPHQAALLGDFLDTFSNTYQERMEDGESTSPEQLTNLALKLLIDLLFYSAPNGSRRLWLALLDRSMRS